MQLLSTLLTIIENEKYIQEGNTVIQFLNRFGVKQTGTLTKLDTENKISFITLTSGKMFQVKIENWVTIDHQTITRFINAAGYWEDGRKNIFTCPLTGHVLNTGRRPQWYKDLLKVELEKKNMTREEYENLCREHNSSIRVTEGSPGF